MLRITRHHNQIARLGDTRDGSVGHARIISCRDRLRLQLSRERGGLCIDRKYLVIVVDDETGEPSPEPRRFCQRALVL